MGAQAIAQLAVIAFGKQVQVHFPEQLAEAVGVFGDLLAAGPLDLQQVALAGREMPDKQAGNRGGIQAAKPVAAVTGQHLDTQGLRQECADNLAALLIVVGAEERKRIRMFGAHQGFNILGCRHDREFRLQRFFMCKAHDFSHRL